MILVIDNTQKSWSLKYKLFRSASDAVDYANSIGYSKSLIRLLPKPQWQFQANHRQKELNF